MVIDCATYFLVNNFCSCERIRSKEYAFDFNVVPNLLDEVGVKFIVDNDIVIPNEGYFLKIDQNGVNLKAKSEQGIFYGIQTLRQLINSENGKFKLEAWD